MRTAFENAFNHFLNKYHAAVQIDTELGECDWDGERYYSLLNKSKKSWADAREAEAEFKKLWPKEDNGEAK